ncbi:MAG: T9SS type A sorting domain-containing protein [Calditrichaeota bacterium]|nr:T9SS type A sorting domain-containing protein [Calditrichota bacterium]
MTKALLVLFAVMLVLGFALNVGAQTTLPLLWQDTFDDATDTLAWHNVGWIYYHESDGLTGSAVQQQDGLLYMKAGSFGGMVGAVIAETNGLPVVGLDENGDMTPETIAGLKANNFNDPNVEYTFQVNFKKITSSFFLLSARMVQNDDSLDSDPTGQPGYALFISPLTGDVNIGKYEGDMAILDPTSYTYFSEGAKFAFDQGVFYWVKYYLKDGDLKVKIWEGDLVDEEDTWLLEVTDPAPRVTGKFMAFGLLNPTDPLAGDEIEVDNVFARATSRFPVTFQLNMDVQEQLGTFNPATDKVVVRGDFSGWWAGVADSLVLDEDDGLYKATIGIPDSLVGISYEYKFVIIPADGDDILEDVPNRTFTLEDGGNVLEPVYFGNQETSVKRVKTDALPRSYALDQNYPNPFNPTTEIAYEIPTNSHVVLTIFNALGQKISTLVDKEQAAGRYQVTWDGLSSSGARMTSGVYFYHIQAEGFNKTMKMIMMK